MFCREGSLLGQGLKVKKAKKSHRFKSLLFGKDQSFLNGDWSLKNKDRSFKELGSIIDFENKNLTLSWFLNICLKGSIILRYYKILMHIYDAWTLWYVTANVDFYVSWCKCSFDEKDAYSCTWYGMLIIIFVIYYYWKVVSLWPLSFFSSDYWGLNFLFFFEIFIVRF